MTAPSPDDKYEPAAEPTEQEYATILADGFANCQLVTAHATAGFDLEQSGYTLIIKALRSFAATVPELGALPMPSAHDHGNCELCDWQESRISQLERELAEAGRKFDDLQAHYSNELTKLEGASVSASAPAETWRCPTNALCLHSVIPGTTVSARVAHDQAAITANNIVSAGYFDVPVVELAKAYLALSTSGSSDPMPKAFATMPPGILTRLKQYEVEGYDIEWCARLLDELTRTNGTTSASATQERKT